MQYKTYAEIKTEVRQETDTEGEIFIQESELLRYANRAIDEAEAEIHTIYEDYFLRPSAKIPLVNGQTDYDLPTDIYANKIRQIIYENGSDYYKLRRVRGRDKYLKIASLERAATSEDYRYLIVNESASVKPVARIYPVSTGTGTILFWYLRNANRMVDDTSICDIPEFSQFVIQHMVSKIYEKEGHPNTMIAKADLERYRRLMVDTLSQMIPDGDNTIEPDVDFYHEHY